jgi:hypothetical protein
MVKDRIYLTFPRSIYMKLELKLPKLREHILSIYPNASIRISITSLRAKNGERIRIKAVMEDKGEEFPAHINIANVLHQFIEKGE